MTRTANKFQRRQVVRIQRLIGPRFEPDWNEKAVVVAMHPEGAITQRAGDEWYVIRFEDGGMITSPASRLMASNESPFKGRLPTYAATQRRAR